MKPFTLYMTFIIPVSFIVLLTFPGNLLAEEELLVSGNELLIKLPGSTENAETYPIDFEGFIFLPTVGKIRADGKSLQEVRLDISNKLPQYIRKISPVEISVLKRGFFIQLTGHVFNPGWYVTPQHFDIEQVLSMAGGIVDGAVMSKIHILRNNGPTNEKIIFDYSQYLLEGDRDLLPQLNSKDIIFVPRTSRIGKIQRRLGTWFPPKSDLDISIDNKIRVVGEVKKPGFVEYIEGGNILDFISLAGGPTISADLKNVILISGANNGSKNKFINLAYLLNNGNLDAIYLVYPGDTIFVNSKHENITFKSWRVFRDNIPAIFSLVLIISKIKE